MTEADILPCPFCGSDPDVIECGVVRYIKCSECGTEQDGDILISHMVARWNRRAGVQPLPRHEFDEADIPYGEGHHGRD
ncbi:Lar family restriction alleviation protein [Rhizobium panacihumi]|uniref:Lar family restriction alleviation protein n=1 Tax=Rhizobium panacihumi TaxID=2008450 RepID=UPI003D7A9855